MSSIDKYINMIRSMTNYSSPTSDRSVCCFCLCKVSRERAFILCNDCVGIYLDLSSEFQSERYEIIRLCREGISNRKIKKTIMLNRLY
jgi:hypothetical protein